MPSVEDNAKIVAAAKADPDAQPMTKTQLTYTGFRGFGLRTPCLPSLGFDFEAEKTC